MEDEPTGPDPFGGIGRYFRHIAVAHGDRGPIGAIIVALSEERLSPAEYDQICRKHGVGKEIWFRRQILDLILGYVSQELEKGPLSVKAQHDLRELRHFLHVGDGEFMRHRAAEIATLLADQFEVILADFVINDAEELQQVELQAVFGLSYDDYLALIRGPLERVVGQLSELSRHGSVEDRSASRQKLSALEPMYRLVTARGRTLGALY